VPVEIFKEHWHELTEGKPIVAIAHLFNNVSLHELTKLWDAFVGYKRPFPASGAYHLIIKNTCLGINQMLSHVRNSLLWRG
jgi:hypothetical protein